MKSIFLVINDLFMTSNRVFLTINEAFMTINEAFITSNGAFITINKPVCYTFLGFTGAFTCAISFGATLPENILA